MPYCEAAKDQTTALYHHNDHDHDHKLNSSIRLFYRTYGRGPTKILLIIGLAGTHDSWGPQIKELTGTDSPNDEEAMIDESGGCGGDGGGIEVCAFDNRGMVGALTKTMAKDSIALLDHLGWKKAHVFGHSMGAMIACKVAAMVPDRVLSLALLNVTGGGFECFPRLDRKTLSIAIRFLRAKTPEQRAAVDLDTHYTKEFLEEYIGPNTKEQSYIK
ncbi:hypothetical protein LWI29_020667 [Acer saccharum]|uniref:AB hydrolase-1 domain-containing protein n=1 Tax=Acer saccharum TaxID=4024 RepID=A0AA39VR05_ACESA|nr:hypothetical protein LWI29_020667 [Acer saccharum]